MSFSYHERMAIAWGADFSHNPALKLVLLYLAENCDEDGRFKVWMGSLEGRTQVPFEDLVKFLKNPEYVSSCRAKHYKATDRVKFIGRLRLSKFKRGL